MCVISVQLVSPNMILKIMTYSLELTPDLLTFMTFQTCMTVSIAEHNFVHTKK